MAKGCCEAALWTSWVHIGTLHAATMCDIVSIDASKFSELVRGYETVDSFTVSYARVFVRKLNDKNPEELSDLAHQLNIVPFLGKSKRMVEASG